MKLIIDIEPRYCKDMQSDVKELYYEAINRITEAVRNGRPYDERPQGEWIMQPHSMIMRCSLCENEETAEGIGIVDTNKHFCSNCGADMRKGDAE